MTHNGLIFIHFTMTGRTHETGLTEPSWQRADLVMSYQEAADGGVDLPEDVADHVQSRDEAELQSVVDHHGDEHDVPRVLIEDTRVKDGHELRGIVLM